MIIYFVFNFRIMPNCLLKVSNNYFRKYLQGVDHETYCSKFLPLIFLVRVRNTDVGHTFGTIFVLYVVLNSQPVASSFHHISIS